MRTFWVILMLVSLVGCGKKEAGGSGPAPAPEEKAQEEDLSEMAADRPKSIGPPATGPSIGPPATGEGKADDPADTRDATPTEPPADPEPGAKLDPGLVSPMDEVKTVAPRPGLSSMAAGTKTGGGAGGGPGGGDLDDPLRDKLKRQPKPDTKATGFHDKEQDEPTQE